MKCSNTSKLSVTQRKQNVSNSLFEQSVYSSQISENMVSLIETSSLLSTWWDIIDNSSFCMSWEIYFPFFMSQSFNCGI